MKAMWPGLYGNAGGSTHVISKRRKLAVQASRFMVQMVQTQLFSTESMDQASKSSESASGLADASNNFDISEEGLAIRIALEVSLNNLGNTCTFYSNIAGHQTNILSFFWCELYYISSREKLTSCGANALGSQLPR